MSGPYGAPDAARAAVAIAGAEGTVALRGGRWSISGRLVSPEQVRHRVRLAMELDPAIDDEADAEKARLGWAPFPGSRCPRYSEDWDAWGNSGFFGDMPTHPVWAHEDGRRLCETCAAPEMWLSA